MVGGDSRAEVESSPHWLRKSSSVTTASATWTEGCGSIHEGQGRVGALGEWRKKEETFEVGLESWFPDPEVGTEGTSYKRPLHRKAQCS